ncbi:MAG: hypothetical protein JO049_00305 [Hyphomicrobiales bacterium]|nr:hypothetical protein [Hyphomicrobiales bacterium]
MGDSRVLTGHVESIASGVDDQNRITSTDLLALVNPTFSWVRLAPRIPVRVKLDDAPADLALVSGRTATVSIGKIAWWQNAWWQNAWWIKWPAQVIRSTLAR